MIDLALLPALPLGWRYEPHVSHPDVVHVVWTEHEVAASINFKLRSLDSGWCIPVRRQVAECHVGRQWRYRLVHEAIRQLQAIWNTP